MHVPGTIYESTAAYMYENIGYVQPEHHLFAKYWYHVRMNIGIHFHCDVPRTIFLYLVPGAFVVIVAVEKMIKKK